jgi:hypothetical protein
MPDPVTPPAADPAAPGAADPAKTADPAKAGAASLLDAADPAKAAADPAKAADPDPAKAADPAKAEPEWFYANGVKGTGPVPEWYKATKYRSVDEQAKAYTELEKRFGTFTGAPKDGKYEFKMPEGIEGELDREDPKFKEFTSWAVEAGLSQDGYQKILSLYVENLAALEPDIGAMKASLGEKADERIGAVSAWTKANLDDATQAKVKAATSGANAAEVFEAIEAVIAKTRQVALPKPGAADPANGGVLTPQQQIDKMMTEKVPGTNKLRFFEEPAFRAQVEALQVKKLEAAANAA